MIISLGIFQFFKILIFWVVRGVKGQKMVQNDKKFCLLHLMFQEPHIICSWFMVHMCKRIISSGIFFIVSNFWFLGSLGGKRARNGPKWQKILSVSLHISGTIHHMVVICGTQVQNDDIFSNFFHFFKILIFGVFRGGEGGGGKTAKNDLELPISVCHVLYLRNCRSYH